MTNVLTFNGKNNNDEITTHDEAKAALNEIKESFNSETADFLYEGISNMLSHACIVEVSNEKRVNKKDYMLLYQSIRSILDRYHGLDNEFHDFVEDFFKDEDEDQYEIIFEGEDFL